MRWILLSFCLTNAAFANDHPWRGKPYMGDFQVKIAVDYTSVKVNISTDDLILRPVTWDQFSDYTALFADTEVMCRYNHGNPLSTESVYKQLRRWVDRWEEGADPYSAFAVFTKEEGREIFVGHIALDHGSRRGEAELEFLFRKEYWNRGFAKQAVSVILKSYATYLSDLGFYVNLNNPSIPAAPLRVVHARARLDTPFVSRVLEQAGMRHVDDEIASGVFYKDYIVTLNELIALDREWNMVVDQEGEWGVHSDVFRRGE